MDFIQNGSERKKALEEKKKGGGEREEKKKRGKRKCARIITKRFEKKKIKINNIE